MSTTTKGAPDGATPKERGARAGSMTIAMRAVPTPSARNVLRIGVIAAGRVVDERLIKARGDVTIGRSEGSTIVASGKSIPDSMRLFEIVEGAYVLNLTDAMTGRLALTTGVEDLSQVRASGACVHRGGAHRLTLTDDARGKIVLGETTILFQFVAPPPMQSKPALPLAVRGGVGGGIDFGFTVVAALSFLFHFGLAGAVNSDWFDPLVDEDGDTATMIAEAKARPQLAMEEPAPRESVRGTAVPTVATQAPERPSSAAASHASPHVARNPTPKNNAEAASRLDDDLHQLSIGVLGTLDHAGPAESVIMKRGPAALDATLDVVGARDGGVDTTGKLHIGEGGDPIGPHAGLAGIFAPPKSTHPSPPATSGEPGPAVAASTAPIAKVDVGSVKGADAAIARLRYKFRACLVREQQSDPTAGGIIKVRVDIGDTGDVRSAASVSSDASASLTQCVVTAFKSAKFDPPESGATSIFVPIVLKSR